VDRIAEVDAVVGGEEDLEHRLHASGSLRILRAATGMPCCSHKPLSMGMLS
jgi:hypothetical protein